MVSLRGEWDGVPITVVEEEGVVTVAAVDGSFAFVYMLADPEDIGVCVCVACLRCGCGDWRSHHGEGERFEG